MLNHLRSIFIKLVNHILIKFQMPSKKESKKEPSASKASSSKKKPKDGDEDGSKKRKQKKKKDPNAPKRAMSGFMFFSQTEREVCFSCRYYCRSFYPLLSIIILIWLVLYVIVFFMHLFPI